MRHSLPMRLLGLALAVATLAIVATAWLTSRDTGERFRGEFERTLEADTFIYQELMSYAARHDSWDDVDDHLIELAERTDRRVALADDDGRIVADSAESSGGTPPLPSNPTAEIDVLSSNQLAVGTARTSGGDNTGGVVIEEHVEVGPVFGTRTRVGGFLSMPEVPLQWRMTDEEAERRERLAAEARECMKEGELDQLPVDVNDEELRSCVSDELLEPTQAAAEANDMQASIVSDCLDEADIPHTVVTGDRGLRQVVPLSEGDDGAQMRDDTRIDDERWSECMDRGWNEAMESFTADPVVMYTGTTERFDPFFGDGWWRTVLAGLAVLAAATGVTVLVGRRMTRPIHALTAAARRMGAGDRSARVEVNGKDEIADLGRAFNSMAESIEVNEAQRKAMVSDIAHELRTPLSNVSGYLEAAEDGVVPLDSSLVSSLREESALLQRLIDDLQDLALADAGMLRVYPEEQDAAALARQVVAAHRAAADEAGVELRLDAEPVTVAFDPERLRQALGNLLSNAIRFTPEGGTVTVYARGGDESASLVVEDDGPGVPEEHLPHLFDRFYRVEGSRSRETGGSGLGLAICKHLVEAHGGTIDVASTAGAGSVFTIRLPLRQPAGIG
ncbi:HAMP domain-containing protein [Actinobacteria bacterium YIM 96077]|uniref:histidine kinase n=1 Tax=Phytoactinopolyspora halophila TaxID=1981511 RepID=A0A329R0E8_9ACTN|nr:ATP-binding protein [Phytoactinopolyspora halophila]AYY11418.1 HAMP domain-containing protein [Actinobacteria bacterium YIM 96077]RAW18100.1 histidine kinase [Phytoactinopolyspora halophila]